MARAKFNASYKGIGQILRSEQMKREMKARADQIRAKAEALAPVDSGNYVESFRVETEIRKGSTTRAIAKVINDSPHAAYVEWGTSRTPRHRVMGRAASGE